MSEGKGLHLAELTNSSYNSPKRTGLEAPNTRPCTHGADDVVREKEDRAAVTGQQAVL